MKAENFEKAKEIIKRIDKLREFITEINNGFLSVQTMLSMGYIISNESGISLKDDQKQIISSVFQEELNELEKELIEL